MIDFHNEGPFVYASAVMGRADVGINPTSCVIKDEILQCVEFMNLERPASKIGNVEDEQIPANQKDPLRMRLAFSKIESINVVIDALNIAKKQFEARLALEKVAGPILVQINEAIQEEIRGTEAKDLS